MLGFDKTITIYSKRYDSSTKKTPWQKVIVKKASWAGCQKVTTGEGLTSNDGYSVRIPLASMPSGFLTQDIYRSTQNPASVWTVQNGDVIKLGQGPDVVGGIAEVTSKFTDCFTITAVHTDSLTRLLPHLRLEGK